MHTSSTRAPRPLPMPDCIALPPDDSLRDWGAQIGNPPEPTQLLVWKGEQFPGAEKHVEDEGWWDGEVYFAGNCLSSTEPGSRAAIYQTARASPQCGTSAGQHFLWKVRRPGWRPASI